MGMIFQFALILLLLAGCANAQLPSGPLTHLDASMQAQKPPTTSTLIYYAGDVNADDPNVYAFPNGNTLMVPDTATYAAVGSAGNAVATGMLFNVVANIQSGNIFDPQTATYDLRMNVENRGGTSFGSGSVPITVTPTGRMPFGEIEYSIVASFTKPFPARGREGVYWFNLSPQCTDESNPNCSQLEFFVDNTTQQTNSVNGRYSDPQESYINSAYFGYSWQNVCGITENDQQCNLLSWGIYGTIGK